MANSLLRAGKYREALEVFSLLRMTQPGFTPYEQGYALALKRLGESAPDNSGIQETHIREATHPQSQPIDSDSAPLVVVVTPVLNGASFLRASLDSVLNQAGNFFIDYFVKDAGSTDNTLAILHDYRQRIGTGKFPLCCNGIRFRVESSPDKGLYDAVAHGFSQYHLRSGPRDILTYINADDVFAKDAFSVAAKVFQTTIARWICGQINVIDGEGKLIVAPEFPLAYARDDIHGGLHDGKSLYFIQQEGNFWLRELYDSVGGLNRSLKLAGDFDLWRRFAAQTELLALDSPLASFRSRPGQLSEQVEKYYAELDRVRPLADEPAVQDGPLIAERAQLFRGNKAPYGHAKQRPGPICFLKDGLDVNEIAYISRAWIGW